MGIDLFSFFLFLFLTNNSKQAKRPASVHRKAGRFAFAMMVVDVGLVFTVAFVLGFLAALIAYGISMGLGIAPTRFTVPEFPAGNDRAGRNFTPVSLDFLGRTCYNQRSFILFKMLMRTNRGPALHAAERAAPQGCCKQPAMCRTSTTAECRGEPLPGVPVTAQREALPGPGGAIRVEPWNAVDFFRRFIPLVNAG